MPYDLSSPGRRLRFFRQDRQLTQQALGSKAGVDQTSISYYESDRKVPRRAIRDAIAIALGVQPSVIWQPSDLEQAA